LADALERLMLNPEERRALAATGQANVQRLFSLETLAEETARIFEQAQNAHSQQSVPSAHDDGYMLSRLRR
jgi:hypothetical protein